MARLRLQLHGNLGEIPARTFVRFIDNSLKVLSELDRAVSSERTGTLLWTMSDLRRGSALVDIQSRVVRGHEDFAPAVTRAYKNGLANLQVEARTPALFTLDSVRLVRDIVRTIGRNGVTSASVMLPEQGDAVELTREFESNLEALVGVHHKSLGAVEGKLELVSLHHPYRRFNVYHTVTGKGVKCNLPAKLEDAVIGAMKRRVLASGTVSYNAVGEPLSVEVKSLRILGREDDLPSISQMLGLIPDLTGNLTTEEHIRSLRNG